MQSPTVPTVPVAAVDLFCGAGGLSEGLRQAGVLVVAGVDNDPACDFPFSTNIGAPFLLRDVRQLTAEHLEDLWPDGHLRLLAGCAPCQPFSPYRRGADTSSEEQWPLLDEFGRLVRDVVPDMVTMENVPRIGNAKVFHRFQDGLRGLGYRVHWRSCHLPRFGLPQHRRRVVLVASRLGPVEVPPGGLVEGDFPTVRGAIADLPRLAHGTSDPNDSLHAARRLTDINLRRIRASRPGGTWRDWPEDLLAPCHRKATGSSFQSVYARMEWDAPSPTITTLAHNFGTGRFGHPEQDRPISLREAAVLQGFPKGYRLTKAGEKVNFSTLGRLIGNAVPPPLGAAVGQMLLEHASLCGMSTEGETGGAIVRRADTAPVPVEEAASARTDLSAGDEEQPSKPDRYTMRVDLSVLESLGINLYSNAAAVLSELVANAYDAEASQVAITWQPQKDASGEGTGLTEVVVTDDGVGMTVAQINDRFLTAGYKKRKVEGNASPNLGRPYMGRKGIGKLSVFSLARVVDVYTSAEDGVFNGLRIDVRELEEKIDEHKDYHPAPLEVPLAYQQLGTSLVLSDLKKSRAGLTAAALRKRLARRFDVGDQRAKAMGGFKIVVNGSRITHADRQELKKLEFIWEFGDDLLPTGALPSDVQRFKLPGVVDPEKGWKVSGWFGSTRKPDQLKEDEDAGSLRNIIVLARKRPIQEGIIEKLDFSRIFGSYVTGQVQADFLDLDDPDYEDIATSDRQRLIEDDPRVIALQKFLREAFNGASETWADLRPRREAKRTLQDYPKLQEWIDDLPDWQRPQAEKMIGTVAGLAFERKHEVEDRTALFRSSVLAFARIGLRNSAAELDALSRVEPVDLLPLLSRQADYESGLWGDILRSRVTAIDRLRAMTDENSKEIVLQKHLFDHLWLLDPSWERATGNTHMEQDLKRVAPGLFAMDDNEKEITGRIDIRYASNSGRHVIVELKRYGRKVEAKDLAEQGVKYRDALANIFEKQQKYEDMNRIEVIFVLGQAPGTTGKGGLPPGEFFRTVFAPLNGRYVLYDEMIEKARNQYDDYLEVSDTARKLDQLLSNLEEVSTEGESDESARGIDLTDLVPEVAGNSG